MQETFDSLNHDSAAEQSFADATRCFDVASPSAMAAQAGFIADCVSVEQE